MKMYIVDAFTNRPYKGNPAAVCLLDGTVTETWMQQTAAEMNLSETAFLTKREEGSYELRWFTPETEVDLCGHATLASAFVLWNEGCCSNPEIRFMTKSGWLTARKSEPRGAEDGWIDLNFPLEPEKETSAPKELSEALGVPFQYVGKNRFDYIVEVADEETVRTLQPDFNKLNSVDTRGVIVTARSEQDGIDFVSRFFCPSIGVNEDPVTGSAHCCLGPYWQGRLGKDELTALQVSVREGKLRLKISGERIIISGQAVLTLRGEITAIS